MTVEPPTASAMAIAASSPEGNIKPYSRSLSVSWSPACNFALLPSFRSTSLTASWWIVTGVFKSPACIAMSAVIILVVLAIGTGVSPFDSYRMWLVSLSNKIDSLAEIAGGFPLAVNIGVGLGVGVGVKAINVAVGVDVGPSKSRFPIGVKVKIGTRIMVVIEMNNRAIAIERRNIVSPDERNVGTGLAPVLV